MPNTEPSHIVPQQIGCRPLRDRDVLGRCDRPRGGAEGPEQPSLPVGTGRRCRREPGFTLLPPGPLPVSPPFTRQAALDVGVKRTFRGLTCV